MGTADIPEPLKERWHIRAGVRIADTRSGRVYRVDRRGDAPSAIVKILKPEGLNELPGMAFLGWRDGRGAVRLLDRIGNACLLEDAGTMILRDHHRQFGDEAATDVILGMLADLHAPSPSTPPAELTPLPRHFRSLFLTANRVSDPALAEILRWGAALADELLGRQGDIRPLHGDLHHDNIVAGSRRGWLAIDPQGLIGDPAYDVANVFGNPLGGAKDILDPIRIRRLTTCFSAAIGCLQDKILRYAAAHAAVSICWSMEGEQTAEAMENIAERSAFAAIVRQMLAGPTE